MSERGRNGGVTHRNRGELDEKDRKEVAVLRNKKKLKLNVKDGKVIIVMERDGMRIDDHRIRVVEKQINFRSKSRTAQNERQTIAFPFSEG
jgi:hypothetical protein